MLPPAPAPGNGSTYPSVAWATVPAAPDDWRRQGQERDLPPGTMLVLERYRAPSETWEHDDVLTEGYTTGRHWVCPTCAADFAEELGLRVEAR